MNIKQRAFMKWLHQGGATIPKATLHRFEDGMQGVVATEHIAGYEVIALLPLSLLITVQAVRTGPLRGLIRRYPHLFNPSLSDDADFNVLTLQMYSFPYDSYAPYLDVGEDCRNMFSWPKPDIEAISAPAVKEQFRTMEKGMMRSFGYFMTLFDEQADRLPPLVGELWDLFVTSYQFVMTRCYGDDGMLPSTCLVPFGDSMNHSHVNHTSYCLVNFELEKEGCQGYQKKTELLDFRACRPDCPKPTNHQVDIGDPSFDWMKTKTDSTYLAIYAIEAIEKGNQVYNFFGEKKNEFLLLWYGFCLPGNPFDKLTLYVCSDGDFKWHIKKPEAPQYRKFSLKLGHLNYAQDLIQYLSPSLEYTPYLKLLNQSLNTVIQWLEQAELNPSLRILYEGYQSILESHLTHTIDF